MKLFLATISLALSVMTNAQEAKSIRYNTASDSQIIITDLGLLPGGTFSSGLAINNQPVIVGLANDSTFAFKRPFWDANTGVIIGFADNFSPASTAIPEHVNGSREMAGSEVYGDNVYQGIYWNSIGQAFVLPAMAGVDPFYGGLHTRAHGINNLGQLVGTGKEAEPNFYTHAVLWPNKDTEGMDLGFLGQGIPLNYSEAYGVNNLSHAVGNSAVGSAIHGFLWRNGQMTDLGPGQAKAINNTGLIAGLDNLTNKPAIWEYDITNPNDPPRIHQLPIPAGFFSATTTAVNDSGDVVGYAGSPSIDAHAVLWRNGQAIDLGVWPGGHYSVAKGINNLGQIVGTGTVAGDNLDHALMWTVDAPVTATSVVSRKTHGTAGAFDINLPLTGGAGIECRSGGANSDHQVVFTFPTPVTLSGATVSPEPGKSGHVAGPPIISPDGRTVTVNLTDVTDVQTITLTLLDVNNGTSTNDVNVLMRLLVGDTNANGVVNASDVSQTKSQSGQAVASSNFRTDVAVNGTINAADVALVKSRSGAGGL